MRQRIRHGALIPQSDGPPFCSMTRCDRIDQLRWRHGAALQDAQGSKLSPSEKLYFESYSAALTAYMEGVDVDLAKVRSSASALMLIGASCTAAIAPRPRPFCPSCRQDLAPPKSTHVLVRALRNCGEVLTADGRSVELKVGSTIKMFAVDAEPLIRKGDLCHVDEKS